MVRPPWLSSTPTSAGPIVMFALIGGMSSSVGMLSTSIFAIGGAAVPSAWEVKSRQIRVGSPPPCMPARGVLSSLPTQTPVIRSPANPTKIASRLSWVVPVLPNA